MRARAIVFDELVAALDIPMRAQIMEFLRDLQKRHKLANVRRRIQEFCSTRKVILDIFAR
jgi:ABC-type dipeptide/oligopeptide/nickel transport system ATPase subunit